MQVEVLFHSYFRDLAGCARTAEEVPNGTTLGELYRGMSARFPKLAAMEKSTLMAVGVDYQPREYVLHAGDQVSFFPPVQGG